MSILSIPSGTVHLASPVCMALGHVFQGGPLPFKDGIKDEEAGDNREGLTMMELIKCLRKILESSKDIKVYRNILANFILPVQTESGARALCNSTW